MTEIPLKNKIIAWLKGCDYWFQYAGNRLIEGEQISDELIEKTYQLFKEDFALKDIDEDRDSIIFNEIEIDTSAVERRLHLRLIKEIENVNALAVGQSIPINSNLTIIYGGNGAGKSGYIRLLNNAFSSRGDKQILHNVFVDSVAGEPACKFTFQADAEPYDLTYPLHKANFEFSQYSVFDTHSIRALLEQDNKLDFTPIGFEFFEKVLELYEAIKVKLNKEITTNKPINEFAKFFVNENELKNLVTTLGAKTKVDELKKLGEYTEESSAKLAEFTTKREELKALDIPKKITELQKLKAQLLDFSKKQQAVFDNLRSENIEYYNSIISSFHKFDNLAKQEGLISLEKYNIEGLGSKEWKEFIRASKNYTLTFEMHKEENTYPSEKEKCIFCLQPLSEMENTLIHSYWSLLKSEAEGELNRTIKTIQEIEVKLKQLSFINFDETTALFEYIRNNDETFAAKWKDVVATSRKAIHNIITNLENRNVDLPMTYFEDSTKEFDGFITKLDTTINDLFEKNPAKEITELDKQIQFYTDKSLLNKLLKEVLLFVETHKWAEKAEKSISALNTKAVTIKQGELFAIHITDKYTDLFSRECELLNAPKVVQIAQRNTKGSTLRKLKVAGKGANSILSEGEQRAISLSDFLTEVQLNPNNKGVFFDDPVTSQDHYRREKIAERLVDLASQKQVIIFTHDIAFFIRLRIFAESKNIPHGFITIRNAGGKTPGVINQDLPWIAQPVKQRIGTLKDRLVRLKKIEQSGNEDEYLFEAKSWYELLREAWERAVEERLFKGVIERFLLGVQTQKLKKVNITDELLSDIEKGMTESSSWIHDSGAGLNPAPPNTAKAESNLRSLSEFAAKCLPA